MWQNIYDPKIVKKGKEIFLKKKILIMKYSYNEVEALVAGERVEISMDGFDLNRVNCTCENFNDEDLCEHITALFFYLDTLQEEEEDVEEINPEVLRAYLETIETEKIYKFMIGLFMQHPEIFDTFQEMIAEVPENLESYKQEFSRILNTYGSKEQYVVFHDEIIRSVVVLMSNVAEVFIADQRYRELFEITIFTYRELIRNEISRFSLGDSYISEVILFVWNEIFEVEDTQYRKLMLKLISGTMSNVSVDYWVEGIHDFFEDLFGEDDEIDKILIETMLKISTTSLPYTGENEYLGFILEIQSDRMINILALHMKRVYGQEYFIQTCEENMHVKYFRNLLIESKEHSLSAEEFIKFLESVENKYSLQTDSNTNRKLEEAYLSANEIEKYRKRVHKRLIDNTFEAFNSFHPYVRLRDTYPKDQWEKVRNDYMQDIQDVGIYQEVLYDEQLYDQLLESVVTQDDYETFFRYKDVLYEYHQGEIIEVYPKFLSLSLLKSQSRVFYKDIVHALREMVTYYGDDKIASRLVEEWIEKYPDRPAMIEELRRL